MFSLRYLKVQTFRLRGAIWTVLFLVIFLLARVTLPLFYLGLPFVLLGQALRLWAVGCIGRYRGEKVGAERLTTWGPYAFVRNPLYVGNGLIGLGWALMAGPWAVIVFILTFTIVYGLLIVPHEESFLLDTFGSPYQEYRNTTGAFFPKSWPSGRIAGPFSLRILWVSERYTLLSTVLGTFLIASRGPLF